MNQEAVLISAYALATQERYEEAEALLQSCPEAYNTVSGMDLLARIRHSQGRIDEARSIWQHILDADPTNESIRMAIEAIENPEPEHDNPHRMVMLAVLATIVLGVIASVVYMCRHQSVPPAAPEPSVVYVTNEVEKIVTNEVVKTVPEIVERVVTNFVDRPVEVKIPVVSVVTTEVERVVCVTNTVEIKDIAKNDIVSVLSTNDVEDLSVSTKTVSDKVPSDGIAVLSDGSPDEVKPPDVRRTVYCPEYVIKPGDEVLKLAKRYSFRIPDFRAVNPAVDENHVRVGQKVKIPGFFDEGKLPK